MFAGSYFAKAFMLGVYFPPIGGATLPPPPPFTPWYPHGRPLFTWPPDWPIDLDDEELTFWVM